MSETTEIDRRSPAIRVIMLPRDTNALGTIFGGIILSYIDQAGAVPAQPYVTQRLVTVAMDKVEFHQPVFVGDLVSFYAEVVEVGDTSLTVQVIVEAQRRGRAKHRVLVTEARVTYVHVNESGRPLPLVKTAGEAAPV